jgi:hypothetical protein
MADDTPPQENQPADPQGGGGEREAIRQIVREGAGNRVERLPSTQELATRDKKQDLELKAIYGYLLLALVLLQIVVADVIFIVYARHKKWDVDPNVMKFWLAATVVEVIGMVTIVVRYLFPRRDRS